MYAGKLVELATVEQIFANPRHPYTRLLISSLPDTAGKRRLKASPGAAAIPARRASGMSVHVTLS